MYAGTNMDLEQAISRLPERARTVLVLFDVEGYSHAEIAELAKIASQAAAFGERMGQPPF